MDYKEFRAEIIKAVNAYYNEGVKRTLDDLAKLSGVSRTVIRDIKLGVIKEYDAKTLEKLSKALSYQTTIHPFSHIVSENTATYNEHKYIISRFIDQELAKEINEGLLILERLDPDGLQRIKRAVKTEIEIAEKRSDKIDSSQDTEAPG